MVVFLATQPTGGAWRRLLVRGSGFGWRWVALFVDQAQDGTRAKDGAVA